MDDERMSKRARGSVGRWEVRTTRMMILAQKTETAVGLGGALVSYEGFGFAFVDGRMAPHILRRRAPSSFAFRWVLSIALIIPKN